MDHSVARDRLAIGPPGPKMPLCSVIFQRQLDRLLELVAMFRMRYHLSLVRQRIFGYGLRY